VRKWQNTVLQALAQFLTLPEESSAEWRVMRPKPKAYKAAVSLISEVPASNILGLPLPRVAPNRQGGIQFEWEKGSYALEIGISPNGTFEVLKVTPSGEEEGHASFTKAREHLIWLSRA
jgi:hypothetical protein